MAPEQAASLALAYRVPFEWSRMRDTIEALPEAWVAARADLEAISAWIEGAARGAATAPRDDVR